MMFNKPNLLTDSDLKRYQLIEQLLCWHTVVVHYTGDRLAARQVSRRQRNSNPQAPAHRLNCDVGGHHER